MKLFKIKKELKGIELQESKLLNFIPKYGITKQAENLNEDIVELLRKDNKNNDAYIYMFYGPAGVYGERMFDSELTLENIEYAITIYKYVVIPELYHVTENDIENLTFDSLDRERVRDILFILTDKIKVADVEYSKTMKKFFTPGGKIKKKFSSKVGLCDYLKKKTMEMMMSYTFEDPSLKQKETI
jgi:hypothetical protein